MISQYIYMKNKEPVSIKDIHSIDFPKLPTEEIGFLKREIAILTRRNKRKISLIEEHNLDIPENIYIDMQLILSHSLKLQSDRCIFFYREDKTIIMKWKFKNRAKARLAFLSANNQLNKINNENIKNKGTQ